MRVAEEVVPGDGKHCLLKELIDIGSLLCSTGDGIFSCQRGILNHRTLLWENDRRKCFLPQKPSTMSSLTRHTITPTFQGHCCAATSFCGGYEDRVRLIRSGFRSNDIVGAVSLRVLITNYDGRPLQAICHCENYPRSPPSTHEALNQCWFNVGPPSKTLGQR